MNFDTSKIDLTELTKIKVNAKDLFLTIKPIRYLDKRKPRLPRKSSKQTKLQKDTNFIFKNAFETFNDKLSSTSKFRVDIIVYKSQDRLGGGDLDNYCKAILDGITSTKKVWSDDKQVDEINIKRISAEKSMCSFIELTIKKI